MVKDAEDAENQSHNPTKDSDDHPNGCNEDQSTQHGNDNT